MTDLVAKLRIEGNATSAVAEAARAERAMQSLGRAGGQAKGGLDQAATGAAHFERQAGGAGRAASLLGGALAAIGARELVTQINDAAFAAQGFETGLSAVAGGARGAQAETAFLRQESERLGLVVRDQTQAFIGLAGSTDGTRLAGEATREIWLGLVEAGTALNRSSEQQGRAMEAVGQIASKGVVSMEEVRGQLAEAIPGATRIAAEAMGMTTAKFVELVGEGKVLAEDFLPKFAAELRTRFGPALEASLISPLGMARREMAETKNTLFDLQSAAGEGFLEGATAGLAAFNDELAAASTEELARALGQNLGQAFSTAAEGAALLVDNIELVGAALGLLAGAGAARALQSIASSALDAAKNARQAALAHEAAAAATLLEAQAVRNGLIPGHVAYVPAVKAVVAAERELTAARAATTATSIAARGAMTGLLGLVGGPWGAAFLAAGAAVAFVGHELAEAEEQMRRASVALADNNRQVADAEQLLAEAGVSTRDFGLAAADSVSPMDSLAAATKGLANETFRLADARRQAAVEGLKETDVELQNELARVEAAQRRNDLRASPANASLWTPDELKAGGVGKAKVQAPVGVKADGSAVMGEVDAAAYAAQLRTQRAKNLQAQVALTFAPEGTRPTAPAATSVAEDGKGKGQQRATRLAGDLAADVVALQAYREALALGGAALDAFRIKDAGRQAVEKAGLAHKATLTAAEQALAASIRQSAEDSERLKLANERVEKAIGLKRSADEDTAALIRRSEAAAQGEAALEALQIKEAGLAALREISIETLDQLTGKDREAAAAAVDAAEARERQAIATQKANQVAGGLRELDRQIASERARTEAIEGGIKAQVDYAKAEKIKQEIDRYGTTLTEAQIQALRTKLELLYDLAAANDNKQAIRDQERELELLRMTNRERQIEIRARERARELAASRKDLTAAEVDAEARIRAAVDVAQEEAAQAIGDLKEGLRSAFIESGEVGFDQVADYAERELRAAVYDALLAEPINVIINAVVGNLNGLKGQLAGLAGGRVGAAMGGGGLGYAAGSAMGLGTGNMGLDLGISMLGSAAGGALASSMAGGWIGAGIANGATALGASAGLAGGMGALLSSAAVLGPLAAIAALAAVTLFKDDKRPYARTDIGVQGGKFAVTGGQELDEGPLSNTNQIGKAITESLNAAADLFKLDLSKIDATVGSIGYVEGKNTGKLGQGYFGGGGGGFSGAEFTNFDDPEKLAAEIVRSTILKAINAGASDLTAAEQKVVREAADLEEAAQKIAVGRSIGQAVDDAILQLTNPAEFERKTALDAIEANYKAMKTQAEELISSGLATGELLGKIDQLRDLQVEDALERLGEAADSAAEKLKRTEQAGSLQADIRESFLKILDPAGYQMARGTREITEAIKAMRDQAKGLIATGDLSADVLGQLDQLEQLQLQDLADQLAGVGDAAGDIETAFDRMRPKLLNWLDASRTSQSAELSPQAAAAEAWKVYQETLAKARGGDEAAGASLGAAADRFLELDRMATDNAATRRSRFEQIQGDIAGVAGMGGAANDNATLGTVNETLKKALLDPESGLLAKLGGAKPLPITLANMPALKLLYGEAMAPQVDRQVDAITKLQTVLEAGLKGLQGSSDSLREALITALAALDGQMDEMRALASANEASARYANEEMSFLAARLARRFA